MFRSLVCDCQLTLSSCYFISLCITYCHFSFAIYGKCKVFDFIVASRCCLFVEYIFSSFKTQFLILTGFCCPFLDYIVSLLDLDLRFRKLDSSDIYFTDLDLMWCLNWFLSVCYINCITTDVFIRGYRRIYKLKLYWIGIKLISFRCCFFNQIVCFVLHKCPAVLIHIGNQFCISESICCTCNSFIIIINNRLHLSIIIFVKLEYCAC